MMRNGMLRLLMWMLLLVMLALPALAEDVHVLDATADLTAMAQGEKADGDSGEVKGYFTIMYSAKNKIDGSNKAFDDGYTATQRLNFGGKTQPGKGMINSVRFETAGAATVKFWWVSGGDGRQFALYGADGSVLKKTDVTSVKNSLYISEMTVDAAGVYYLGVPDGSNYLFRLEVAEGAPAAEVAQPAVHVLDATADLTAMAQGEKADGDSGEVKGYFTIMYSAKNKIDGSNKAFDDGYTATQRLNFGGKTQPGKGMINSVRFETAGAATVKFWWVSGGDGRQFALYGADGSVLKKTDVTSVKNSLYISEMTVDAAGVYYLGVPDGSNYLFRLEVAEGAPAAEAARAAWSGVAAPAVISVQQEGGALVVAVSAKVGPDGGDEVLVTLAGADGEAIVRRSIAEKDEHVLTFEPAATGAYAIRAELCREGEAALTAEAAADFVLPLGVPVIAGATSVGGGKVELAWNAVSEATGYEVLLGGQSAGVTAETSFTVTGLEVGARCTLAVRALRGDEAGEASREASALVTEEAQRAWSFTVYGPSTNEADNGFVGSLNEDGAVTVYSENGKGKIQPNADDGVAFYYTAIPAERNFTLRARVHVDNWDYSNGQEGFGLMAADSVPPTGTGSFFTNQYMALIGKIEYYWNGGRVSTSGTKYTMRLGVGVLAKLGRRLETTSPVLGVTHPLESYAARYAQEGVSNYNVIGNNTDRAILDKTALTVLELTDFVLEIRRDNTGFTITYYDEAGKVIGQYVDYDRDALLLLDEETMYVGFFAARRARATFSEVTLQVTDPARDAAAQERPVTELRPTLSVTSGAFANSEHYTLSCVTNVAGTIRVKADGETLAADLPAAAEIRNDYPITLPGSGEILLEVIFTPDPAQTLPENTVLASTREVWAEHAVVYSGAFAGLSEIVVAPSGTPAGLGTRERPLSLAAAVQYVRPGQTILLTEGVYTFVDPLRIPHGMDGTADSPIRMVADPQAKSRPVLDFKGRCAGVIHGGDHWYFAGFDVTGAANGQKGFQVSGHHNTLEDIHAHHNGNTGIQISRYAGSDPVSEWPSHNLILNCTSWANADAGYEDADGFAAKLTCGEGNVFDGCVAYHNADDGFDLYAKVETGPIGRVIIRNSVAYSNGFLEDGTDAGNGNGFKLGGSNMPGGHELIGSYAFFNKSKGIDSNSCPDVIVRDCVSYNNLRYNVAFYTNLEQDTAYQATNLISFKDASIPGGDPSEGDEFKPRGAQDPAAYLNDSCFYWNGAVCENASGQTVGAEWFKSLEFRGVLRREDGSVDLQGFLERAE